MLSSVFDIRHLDDALAALYLWPNAEMAAEGNLVGWCLTSECMDQAFVVRVTELTLLGGSRSSEALGFSVPDITVGDYSLLTFVLSVLISGVLVNLAMLLSDLIARLLFTRFDASKCSLPSVLPWPDPAGNSKPFGRERGAARQLPRLPRRRAPSERRGAARGGRPRGDLLHGGAL